MGQEKMTVLRLRMGLRSEEDRLERERGIEVAELELPRKLVLEDDPVFVREQWRTSVELGLVEQLHGMVLVELGQSVVLAVQPVRLAFAQRAFPWKVPPVS